MELIRYTQKCNGSLIFPQAVNCKLSKRCLKIETLLLKTDDNSIHSAADVIKHGGLVAFPTETVYGLGANAFDEEAVKNIFRAKGRPADNPLIVHICDFKMAYDIVEEISDSAKIIMDAFMPGPITVILKKSNKISKTVTAGHDTVALRYPSHSAAQKLIKLSGVPIAAPSANLSGKPSPTIARHVIDDLMGRVDAIIDGGECDAGVESTIVDCTEEIPVILRPGIITHDDIAEYIPDVKTDKHILKSLSAGEIPKCPGMKYKHYAPNASVTVVEGDEKKVKEQICSLINENKNEKIGVLSCSGRDYENAFTLKTDNGNRGYAHSLFTYLRTFDEVGCTKVFAEFCIFDKFELSVKNRLYKSAGGNIIHV